jgi:hypothetical protein
MSTNRRLHRASSTPVASGEDEETYNHHVDSAVHSMIAEMEQGDDGRGDDDDDDDDDDVDFHGDDTEVLFMRSTDPLKMVSSSHLVAGGGTLADHEDEMLAEVNSNRDFRDKRGGKTCPRWNIGNSHSAGWVPIVLTFGFLIMVASITISYSNNLARTHGLHGPVVLGLHHAVPAPPPDLTLVCSEHFYHDVRCRYVAVCALST